ncbi:MAG TPA: dTMP kinase [Aliidongia sp.]|nr:dTMP kinase [Aliidongia sp.]
MNRRGTWLTLEGGEGSGKSGVAAHLAEALRLRGYPVLATREPGGTPEGQMLRSLLLAADAPAWEPAAELLLMAAARVQHVTRVVEPALEAGSIVVCDRYVGSTIAYQGAGRGLPEALIRSIHAGTTGDAWPDLTLLLDIDPAIGLARSRRRLSDEAIDEGRFEDLDLDFHQRVRASFLDQAARDSGRTVIIDASRSRDDVADDALKVALAHLNRLRP